MALKYEKCLVLDGWMDGWVDGWVVKTFKEYLQQSKISPLQTQINFNSIICCLLPKQQNFPFKGKVKALASCFQMLDYFVDVSKKLIILKICNLHITTRNLTRLTNFNLVDCIFFFKETCSQATVINCWYSKYKNEDTSQTCSISLIR